jgi:hypothetical protein
MLIAGAIYRKIYPKRVEQYKSEKIVKKRINRAKSSNENEPGVMTASHLALVYYLASDNAVEPAVPHQ